VSIRKQRRLFHFIYFVTLIFCAGLKLSAAAGRVSDEEIYTFKLQRLKRDDHNGFLELGKWAEEKGQIQWARQCYRKTIEVGHTTSYAPANFLLARIEISIGKSSRAFTRLREIISRYGHKEAEQLLARAENKILVRQKDLFNKAKESFQRHLYVDAREFFMKALELLPEKHTGGRLINEKTLLREMIKCTDSINHTFIQREGLDLLSVAKHCPGCDESPYPGFHICDICNGGPSKKRCRSCKTRGWKLCSTCSGTGKVLSTESKRLATLLKKISGLIDSSLKNSLKRNLTSIRPVLQNATQAQLILLSKLYLEQKSNQSFWKVIPTIPIPAYINEAEILWRNTGDDWIKKASFLISFTCRYAQFLADRDYFRGLKKLPSSKPDINELLNSSAQSALRAVAFSDQHSGKFLTFEGTLTKTDSYDSYFTMSLKETDQVKLYIWEKEGKRQFKHLRLSPWKKMVGYLDELYPFNSAKEFSSIKSSWKIRFVGRLLQNRFRKPRYIIEVWGIRALYPETQAEICEVMEKPIHIALRDVQLKELLSVIDTLSGLKVQLTGVSTDTRLNMIAEGCTTAKMFDKLSKILSLKIYSNKDQLILAPDGPPQAIEDMSDLLSYIKEKDKGLLVAGINTENKKRQGPKISSKTEVVDNPVQALKKSLNAMIYRDAILHSQVIIHQSKEEKQKTLAKKYLALSQIGHILTSSILTTNFVNHNKIYNLNIRDTKGEEKKSYYIILERKSEGIVVKAAYGTQFFLPGAQLISEESLQVEKWQQKTSERITQRLAETDDSENGKKASELFSAIVLAKTTGLTKQGNDLFKKLIRCREFPWIISTFFPEKEKQLLSLWKQLGFTFKPETGSGDTKAEPVIVAGVEEKKEQTGTNVSDPGEKLPEKLEELKAFGASHLATGKKHRRLSLPGSPEFKKHLKKAMHHFQLTRKAFSKYLQQKPDDVNIRKSFTKTTVLLEGCIKDLPFFN